ncbi:hypothetical protein D3C73_1654990 [compost metagenome]
MPVITLPVALTGAGLLSLAPALALPLSSTATGASLAPWTVITSTLMELKPPASAIW